MSRRAMRTGLLLAAPVLLVLFLKVFLVDVYRVESGSMEPTIRADGELVLVRYDRAPELERFELAVVLRQGEREPAVKRVVGLPGEELRIAGGDLLVDGAKLGAEVPRPHPVLVFDAGRHDLFEYFELEPKKDWDDRGEGVVLRTDGEAQASWHQGLTDDYVLPNGERVTGREPVGDARISARVRLGERGEEGEALGDLFWRLSEEGDLFEARLEVGADEQARVTLRRERRGMDATVLAETSVPFPPWNWHRVAFANVDDHLALEIDGRRVLSASYDGNTPHGGVADPRQRHRRPRAAVGGRAVHARFTRLRLHRDLHYTARGAFGSAEPVRLGPGEVFLLGDNSAESIDGREWGPVSLEEVIGVPLAVPWPLAGARRLDPVAEPLAGP